MFLLFLYCCGCSLGCVCEGVVFVEVLLLEFLLFFVILLVGLNLVLCWGFWCLWSGGGDCLIGWSFVCEICFLLLLRIFFCFFVVIWWKVLVLWLWVGDDVYYCELMDFWRLERICEGICMENFIGRVWSMVVL